MLLRDGREQPLLRREAAQDRLDRNPRAVCHRLQGHLVVEQPSKELLGGLKDVVAGGLTGVVPHVRAAVVSMPPSHFPLRGFPSGRALTSRKESCRRAGC
jgi:hypothetical protein